MNMLAYIGFPPVCELMVMLIALTPVPRTGALYTSCSKNRWVFLNELNQWNFMLQISNIISKPEQYCNCNNFINSDQHSTAAAQLLQEIIEKISLEELGEELLCKLSENTLIIDTLINGIIQKRNNYIDGIRRSCTKMINFLLRRAADMEILCYNHHPNGAPPTATYVLNRLFALRENIVNHTKLKLNDLILYLYNYDNFYLENKKMNKYSSYEVSKPFTSLRAMVIEIIVLMVESEETVASTVINVDTWKMLISWVITYAHNNVYHALFYRLVFAVLR